MSATKAKGHKGSDMATTLALRQYSNALHSYSINRTYHYFDQEIKSSVRVQYQRPLDEVRAPRDFFDGRGPSTTILKSMSPPTAVELVIHTHLPTSNLRLFSHSTHHQGKAASVDGILQQT